MHGKIHKKRIVKLAYPSVKALQADMRGNFPRGGLFIPTDMDFEIDERIALHLTQPGAVQPIVVPAMVARVAERGIDARFAVTDPTEQDMLRSLIEGAAEAIAPPVAGERLNILLVEPNANLRAMFKQGIISSARRAYNIEGYYTVTDVPNGEMARSQLQCNQFSMMVTELRLPLMDGHDLIRAARAGLQPGMPICLMCHPYPGDEAESRSAGATLFRRKPIKRRELFQTLKGVLDPDNRGGKAA